MSDSMITIKDPKTKTLFDCWSYLGPETMLVDSLYGSDTNLKEANKRGVKVTAPAMGYKEKHDIKLSDFEISKDYERIICPMGKKAPHIKHTKERINVGFMIEDCSRCSRLNDCPVKAGVNYYYLGCAILYELKGRWIKYFPVRCV
jgi:hypothetical protein